MSDKPLPEYLIANCPEDRTLVFAGAHSDTVRVAGGRRVSRLSLRPGEVEEAMRMDKLVSPDRYYQMQSKRRDEEERAKLERRGVNLTVEPGEEAQAFVSENSGAPRTDVGGGIDGSVLDADPGAYQSPHQVPSPWSVNPAVLQGRPLHELVTLIKQKDPEHPAPASIDAAIGVLSKDFKPVPPPVAPQQHMPAGKTVQVAGEPPAPAGPPVTQAPPPPPPSQ